LTEDLQTPLPAAGSWHEEKNFFFSKFNSDRAGWRDIDITYHDVSS
jgi:hypothetical protein